MTNGNKDSAEYKAKDLNDHEPLRITEAHSSQQATSKQPITIEAVRGAVARGWCHDPNRHKEMDGDLAIAISDEVWALILADKTPYLGRTSTNCCCHSFCSWYWNSVVDSF